MSVVTVNKISSGDQLSGTGNYQAIRIANVSASSEINHNNAGNVLSDDQNTKWESKGMEEHITLELEQVSRVHRIDIEWDPALPRTGRYTIITSDHENHNGTTLISSTMTGALFESIQIPDGVDAKYIKIQCAGQNDSDLNGITCVKLYGGVGKKLNEEISISDSISSSAISDLTIDELVKDIDEQSSADETDIKKSVGISSVPSEKKKKG